LSLNWEVYAKNHKTRVEEVIGRVENMSFIDDFFSTLQSYNETFLPMTIFTFLLGVFIVYLAVRKSKNSGKIISVLLSFLWIWSGAVFFIVYYGPIDAEFLGLTLPGVWYLGGILFLIQSFLFLYFGVVKSSLSFEFNAGLSSIVGALLIVYAMVIYPLIGFLTGYSYPRYPIFGTAPCPLTIFSIGLLLWSDRKMPLVIVVIPFIWALMGIMPVLALNIWADIGEVFSGIIGLSTILYRNLKTNDKN
jgi:hypothetical protein